jgi:lipopolysaccharide biosynthesis protein
MQDTAYSFNGEKKAMKVRYDHTPSVLTDVCLFSSFSFTGIVEEYVYFYLNELQRTGFSIMFISTSELTAACVERLSRHCFMIIERENKCPDFGSWKIGLSLLEWGKNLNAVLLANDSVFGPFHDLAPVISSMQEKYDVWGMTTNLENEWHIQSYFIYFNAVAASSTVFSEFWKNINLEATKKEVIAQYEIGLSRLFRQNNFRLGAYADINILNQNESPGLIPTNPMLLFWKVLITKYAFPFLKRELMIKPQISRTYWIYNLYVHVGGWKKIIETHSDYPTNNILAFLSNYCAHFQNNNPGLTLEKRRILFVTPVRDTPRTLLLNFLKWLQAETNMTAEIIISSKENKDAEQMFAGRGHITFFNKLSGSEKHRLKERLSDEISIVFWASLDNMELRNFLSFLNTPQLILVSENTSTLQHFFTADILAWLRKNIVQFILTSAASEQLLQKELNIDAGKITRIRPFTATDNEDETAGIHESKFANRFPSGSFIVGLFADPDDDKAAGLLPAICTQLCKAADNIHVLWAGSSLPDVMDEELYKTGFSARIHISKKSANLQNWFPLLSVVVVVSFNNQLPLFILDAARAGKPVLCFDDPAITDEYRDAGLVQTIPYLDLAALAEKINWYNSNPGLLTEIKTAMPARIASHFTSHTEAPEIMGAIKKYFDECELMLAERPLVTFLTHIYYENTWPEIKHKLKDFDNGKNHFLFSISEACLVKEQVMADIKNSFKDACYLVTSNIGKDIGGKMALIDIYLLMGYKSDYIVFLHDKQSPHAVIGESWKQGLFKIIDINNERSILSAFRDPKVGIVGDKDRIVNEYDISTDSFVNNSRISKKLLLQFDMNIESFEFLGGSIYWIRSSIIEYFFRNHHPIRTREGLEAGNVMDLDGERLAHSWERMFSWIATDQGYRMHGI